mmetsp:Transcript_23295/g.62222  ORF Transcript_23295/g.62222 Transcript_23295/m.62222 type:complete len:98 (-) Transcript_23295:45-338(-)
MVHPIGSKDSCSWLPMLSLQHYFGSFLRMLIDGSLVSSRSCFTWTCTCALNAELPYKGVGASLHHVDVTSKLLDLILCSSGTWATWRTEVHTCCAEL